MPKSEPMKAKSKTQRRLFGWAKACVDNKTDNCPTNIKKLGKTFKEKYPEDLKSLAKTKHLGLPNKKNSKNEMLKFNEFGDDIPTKYDYTHLTKTEFDKIYKSKENNWYGRFEKDIQEEILKLNDLIPNTKGIKNVEKIYVEIEALEDLLEIDLTEPIEEVLTYSEFLKENNID